MHLLSNRFSACRECSGDRKRSLRMLRIQHSFGIFGRVKIHANMFKSLQYLLVLPISKKSPNPLNAFLTDSIYTSQKFLITHYLGKVIQTRHFVLATRHCLDKVKSRLFSYMRNSEPIKQSPERFLFRFSDLVNHFRYFFIAESW